MKLLITVAAITFVAAMNGTSQAASDQERCGIHAAAVFERHKQQQAEGTYSTEPIRPWYRYTSNYSSVHNGCYILIIEEESWDMPDPDMDGKKYSHSAHTERLINVDTNHEMGQFSTDHTDSPWTNHGTGIFHIGPMECKFEQRPCAGREEWDAIIQPYMEGQL